MTFELSDFVTAPPAHRFDLAHGRRVGQDSTSAEDFLAPLAAEPPSPPRQATPTPLLYRLFADTPPNPAGFLAFANRHDGLGVAVPFRYESRRPNQFGENPVGEPVAEWRRQVSLMLQLTALCDLVRAEDVGRLARHFRTSPEGTRFVSHVEAEEKLPASSLGYLKTNEVVSTEDLPKDVREAVEAGNVRQAALAYVWRRVGDELLRAAGPPSLSAGWAVVRSAKPVLRVTPGGLASALWLQLADAVIHDKPAERCAECGSWFEVAPQAARSHRRFCSDACRSKAYRGRQDRARHLYHDGGKSFAEIADELDSSEAAVRRWVTGR